MPRGDKSSYTKKQKRKAEHIEEGYEKRGVSQKEAERRAWATVNKESGGRNKSGSGRGKKDNKSSSKKGCKSAPQRDPVKFNKINGLERRSAPGPHAETQAGIRTFGILSSGPGIWILPRITAASQQSRIDDRLIGRDLRRASACAAYASARPELAFVVRLHGQL